MAVQDGATDIVPAYLTATQAAALLNVAKRTFTGMVARGEAPQPTRFGRTGRSVRWSRDAILAEVAKRDPALAGKGAE